MTKQPLDDLVIGKKYRVHYQIPGVYDRPREMVAKLISIDLDTISNDRNRDKFVFSGRPEFGTTDLERRHLTGAWNVGQNTKCYANKKVR